MLKFLRIEPNDAISLLEEFTVALEWTGIKIMISIQLMTKTVELDDIKADYESRR